MRAILRWLGTVLVTGLLAYSGAASAAVISITPNSDPGNLRPGDTLTFTVSVDSIAPPSGGTWLSLNVGVFRILGGDQDNFSGCADLSGLTPILLSCVGANGGSWFWPGGPATGSISGDLVSFTAVFDEAGPYQVFLEAASATFQTGPSAVAESLTVSNTRDNPIAINVAAAVVTGVPEPATLGLVGFGLAALALRRRKRV